MVGNRRPDQKGCDFTLIHTITSWGLQGWKQKTDQKGLATDSRSRSALVRPSALETEDLTEGIATFPQLLQAWIDLRLETEDLIRRDYDRPTPFSVATSFMDLLETEDLIRRIATAGAQANRGFAVGIRGQA